MLSTFASSRAITEYFGPVFNAWDWFGHPQGNKDVLKTYFAYPHVDAALKLKKKKWNGIASLKSKTKAQQIG